MPRRPRGIRCLPHLILLSLKLIEGQLAGNLNVGSTLPRTPLGDAISNVRQASPLYRATEALRGSQANPIPGLPDPSTPVLGTLVSSRPASTAVQQPSGAASSGSSSITYSLPGNPTGYAVNQGLRLSGTGITLGGTGGGSGVRVGTDGITYSTGESQIDVQQVAAVAALLRTLARSSGVQNLHLGLDGVAVNRGLPSEVKLEARPTGLVLTGPRAGNNTQRASVELAAVEGDPASAPSVALTVTSEPLEASTSGPSGGPGGALTVPLSGDTAARIATALQGIVGTASRRTAGNVSFSTRPAPSGTSSAPSGATNDTAESPAAGTLPVQATAQGVAASPDQAEDPAEIDFQSLTEEVTRLLETELRRRDSREPAESPGPSQGPGSPEPAASLGPSQGTGTEAVQGTLAAAEPPVGKTDVRNEQKQAEGTESGPSGTPPVVVPRAPAPAPAGQRRRSRNHGASPKPSSGHRKLLSEVSEADLASALEALQQAPQGGFLGSSGVQAGMGMASGGTGQMQAGTRSDTGMVRMGGHSVFGVDIGAMGYRPSPAPASRSDGETAGGHMALSEGHNLFDNSKMDTDPALLAQDNPVQYTPGQHSEHAHMGGMGEGALAPAALPPAESMDGNPAMAAAYLDSLTHSADARGHVMASMGTAQGAGMHMGFMEGHVPMDGLPLSVLEQLTQEHVALP